MRVTRLEIFGFKSFVDRFVLNFDKDIIGVVGPNGCGKSNIVDSLRWVLGETHAKHLRGGVLEDLIFNGTQNRRPLGMAEVSITLRPGEGFTPQSLAQIQQHAPQKETAGSSPEGGVSDGEASNGVEGALPAPPAPPADEPSGLLDIPGLFDSAEIQLTRRMYRSGESEYFINRVPCRLRDLVELYRIIGLGARGLSIVEQGQIGDIVSKKPLERRELLEEAAGIAGFRARLEVAQRKLGKTTENLARLTDIRGEVERQVRTLSRQAKRARERGELKARLRSLDTAIFRQRVSTLDERRRSLEEQLHEQEQSEDQTSTQLSWITAREEEIRATIESLDVQIADLRQAKDVVIAKVNQHVAHENRLRVELAQLEGQVRLARNSLEQSGKRQESLRNEIGKLTVELETLAETEAKLNAAREEAEQALERLIAEGSENQGKSGVAAEIAQKMSELTTAVAELPEVTQSLSAAEKGVRLEVEKLQHARRAANGKEIALASLTAEVSSFEAQLKTLAKHVTENTGDAAGNDQAVEVLLAGLTVPAELQRAVSAVLGERVRYVLVDNFKAHASQFERKREASGSKFRPVQLGVLDREFRSTRDVVELREAERSVAPSARALLELLKVTAAASELAREFLSNVVVVDKLQEGLELVKLRSDVTAVTVHGEVVSPWGWYTTTGDGGELAFRRVYEEKQAALETVRAEHEELLQALRDQETTVRDAEERRAELHARREELLEKDRALSALARQVEQIERAEREQALRDERQAGEALRQVSTELASVVRTISLHRKRREELEDEIVRIEGDKGRLREEEEERQRAFEAKAKELDDLLRASRSSAGVDGQSPLARLQAEIQELEASERGLQQERNKHRLAFSALEQDFAEARKARDELQRTRHDIELGLDRARIEQEMIREEFQRTYPEELPEQEELPSGSLEEFQKEAAAIRSRIEREGEVDPQSIELFETEQARLNELETQCTDLSGAIAILEKTIHQLKEISRTRFLETFKFVADKFAELVPRLFGGGSGILELLNPEDPLTSGVELSVRPPGKKLRSIELMSGGEKALAATAVLMAMFLHRPSPICVLDEVDAPLDDVNLERFLSLIREISSTTQFLIITHNKQTMAASDRLIGITMEERGVSKALSVSLTEAVDELERHAVNA